MMKKKRFTSLFVGGALLALLAACGQEANEVESEVVPEPEVEEIVEVEPESISAIGTYQADIVIIGGGGAGMVAALNAHGTGVENVVILEQLPFTGGNTLVAIGGFSGADTRYQEAGSDSVDTMVADAIAGGIINDPDLVRIMAEGSGEAVEWISDLGANLTNVGLATGSSVARIHRPADGTAAGPTIVKTLNAAIEDAGIPVFLNTEATNILVDEDGAVAGVVANRFGEEIIFDTTAVILATGGFSANLEMAAYYNPATLGFGTSSHPGSLGTGITMAQELGADMVDMEHIDIAPTTDPRTGMLITSGVRAEGGILINRSGERFVNEVTSGVIVSETIVAQEGGLPFLVFDSSVREALGVIETYITAGFVFQAESIAELAELLEIDPDTMVETVERYNAFIDSGADEDFDRPIGSMRPVEGSNFYAVLASPGLIGTMGGVRINVNAEVVQPDGAIIPGLFAAGEVVGGVHGSNRLSGNSLADAFSFGRLAVETAIAFVGEGAGFTNRTIGDVRPIHDHTPQVDGDFEDGVFTGISDGFGGPLTVEVTVEGGNIVAVEVISDHDTPGFFDVARDNVITQVIRYQDLGSVDAVSGATVSRFAVLSAIRNAVEN